MSLLKTIKQKRWRDSNKSKKKKTANAPTIDDNDSVTSTQEISWNELITEMYHEKNY